MAEKAREGQNGEKNGETQIPPAEAGGLGSPSTSLYENPAHPCLL